MKRLSLSLLSLAGIGLVFLVLLLARTRVTTAQCNVDTCTEGGYVYGTADHCYGPCGECAAGDFCCWDFVEQYDGIDCYFQSCCTTAGPCAGGVLKGSHELSAKSTKCCNATRAASQRSVE